jgi:hypothetical protein
MNAARLAANRANAQMSTGPQNTERTRFNGISHGLTGKQTVIPGESLHQFEAFRETFVAELDPKSIIETTLAERIVAAAWRWKRFNRVEDAFYTDRVNAYCDEHPDADPIAGIANLFVDPVETARMKLFLRYQTSVQREYDKAVTEFRKAQTARERALFDKALAETIRPEEQPAPRPEIPSAAIGFASQTSARDQSAFEGPTLWEKLSAQADILAQSRPAQATRALP